MKALLRSRPLLDERLLEAWGQREAAADAQRHRRLPEETVADIRASSVLLAPVPVELGGQGLRLPECLGILRQVAQHAPATALALAMPLGNAATACIPDSAVPANRRRELAAGRHWIAEQARAGRILAVANSEPGAGGDLENTKTAARLDGAAWRLTGQKAFATFGSDADYFLCAGRTPDGVEGFFVPRDAPGVVVGDDWDGFGMRTSASVTLRLDDAPAAAVLGYRGALRGANARHWSTLLFGAVFVGVGEGALREACKVADPGSPFTRASVAEAALGLEAAAGFLEAVAARDGFPFRAANAAQRAKTVAAQAALAAATTAAVVGGGRCYTDRSPIGKFVRDAMAGPHLRPPLPKVLDAVAAEWLDQADRQQPQA
ncbi:MAG: hypothetical protein QOD77_737 [Thermoplasmata archaeon]|nr:hypothetical protein [Thermoplasmata archaeon]